MKNRGQPTSYTPELAAEICETIATQGKGLKQLCREHPHWPHPDTIYEWLGKHQYFSDLYIKAKARQVSVLADQIIDIADDSAQDITTNKNGDEVCNTEFVNRARLRIDTRKWIAAKLAPRIYGEKGDFVKIKFPNDITKSNALLAMSAEVFRALSQQEIDLEQARNLIAVIKDHGVNIAVGDMNERLNQLEHGGQSDEKTVPDAEGKV